MFALYGNTILNDYSFDDFLVTDTNEQVQKGIAGIAEIFTSNYLEKGNVKLEYRPLAKATFAIEHELFGRSPHISHLLNVILYALTGILLFSILRELIKKYYWFFPVLITLLFLAHPIHTEVVASLKNREEMLSFIFAMLALKYCIRYCKGQKNALLLAGVFFLFGLLSKITILTFLGIIPLLLWFFEIGSNKKIITAAFTLIAVAIIYSALVFSLLPSFEREYLFFEKPITFQTDLGVKTASIAYSMGYYLKLLCWPQTLSFYYGYNQIPIMDWSNFSTLFYAFVYLFLIGFSIFFLKKKNIIALGILIFLFCILPFSNILYGYTGIVSERALYFASLGFCIAVAYLLIKLPKTLLLASIVVLISLCSWKTITRNFDWKNEKTLFAADIKHLENSHYAHDLYASSLDYQSEKNHEQRKKLVDEAMFHFEKALEIYNERASVHEKLGKIYLEELNQSEIAKMHFKKAEEIRKQRQ
ncbi:DUF1736 domain-containing protein [Bacteroidales bacterium AH-315-I05]|nr:DUF1736 domain-containing protein [Bacteroidales bacterium AH-315-I05]